MGEYTLVKHEIEDLLSNSQNNLKDKNLLISNESSGNSKNGSVELKNTDTKICIFSYTKELQEDTERFSEIINENMNGLWLLSFENLGQFSNNRYNEELSGEINKKKKVESEDVVSSTVFEALRNTVGQVGKANMYIGQYIFSVFNGEKKPQLQKSNIEILDSANVCCVPVLTWKDTHTAFKENKANSKFGNKKSAINGYYKDNKKTIIDSDGKPPYSESFAKVLMTVKNDLDSSTGDPLLAKKFKEIVEFYIKNYLLKEEIVKKTKQIKKKDTSTNGNETKDTKKKISKEERENLEEEVQKQITQTLKLNDKARDYLIQEAAYYLYLFSDPEMRKKYNIGNSVTIIYNGPINLLFNLILSIGKKNKLLPENFQICVVEIQKPKLTKKQEKEEKRKGIKEKEKKLEEKQEKKEKKKEIEEKAVEDEKTVTVKEKKLKKKVLPINLESKNKPEDNGLKVIELMGDFIVSCEEFLGNKNAVLSYVQMVAFVERYNCTTTMKVRLLGFLQLNIAQNLLSSLIKRIRIAKGEKSETPLVLQDKYSLQELEEYISVLKKAVNEECAMLAVVKCFLMVLAKIKAFFDNSTKYKEKDFVATIGDFVSKTLSKQFLINMSDMKQLNKEEMNNGFPAILVTNFGDNTALIVDAVIQMLKLEGCLTLQANEKCNVFSTAVSFINQIIDAMSEVRDDCVERRKYINSMLDETKKTCEKEWEKTFNDYGNEIRGKFSDNENSQLQELQHLTKTIGGKEGFKGERNKNLEQFVKLLKQNPNSIFAMSSKNEKEKKITKENNVNDENFFGGWKFTG